MSNTPEERRAHRRALERARRQNPEVRKRQAAAHRKWALKNKERLKENNRAYFAKPGNKARHTEKQRIKRDTPEYRDARRYRSRRTEKNYRQFLAGRPQPEVCDVCGRKEPHKYGTVFDHCHQKGHFRGWLCRKCNWTLGFVEDNPTILLQLIAYLKRTSNGVSRQMSLPGI